MAATGDRLKATKAYVAAALGFIAPGVSILIAEQKGDGIQAGDLLYAALMCLAFGGVAGGAVYAAENKPKAVAAPKQAGDPYPHL